MRGTATVDLTAIADEAVRAHKASQKPAELAELLAFVPPGSTVVEIGCDQGGMLWAFRQAGAGRVIGLTLPGGKWGTGHPLVRHGAEVILGNSGHESARWRLVQLLGDTPVALMLIDADHTYEAARRDFDLYAPLVAGGGVVALHDICHHPDPQVGVERVWAEVKAAHPGEWSEIVAPPLDWGGIGVLRCA